MTTNATDSQTPLLPFDTAPSESWFEQTKTWVQDQVRTLKRQVLTLYIASSDTRTPVACKVLCVVVLAIALSPIDLIPDFIPILGLLDDIVLIPLGMWLAIRMIPADVWADARQSAMEHEAGGGGRLPPNYYAAALIVLFWIAGAVWIVHTIWAWRHGK